MNKINHKDTKNTKLHEEILLVFLSALRVLVVLFTGLGNAYKQLLSDE